jgi:predicted GIY-YIG superfamily endonuclease
MKGAARAHIRRRRRELRDRQREQHIVYGLTNDADRHTYVGVTNDMARRLRQHNGEICNGARQTHRVMALTGKPWRLLFIVSGFPSRRAALQLEWRMHRKTLGVTGLGANPFPGTQAGRRAWQLYCALAMTKVTRSAPRTADMQLQILWRDAIYCAQARASCPQPWPAAVTHADAEALRSEQA